MQDEIAFDNVAPATLFLEVILPLALPMNYTYRVPVDLNHQVAVGKRVIVQFGKNRMYTAVICAISEKAPRHYTAKYIIDVVDEFPIIYPVQLKFWTWISKYYMCHEGDVMSAALPSGLKLASETMVMLDSQVTEIPDNLSDKELVVLTALQDKRLNIEDISGILGQKSIYPVIMSLLSMELIVLTEELQDKYKPLKKTYASLNPFYKDTAHQAELFKLLQKAPKQLDAFISLVHLSRQHETVSKAEWLEHSGAGAAALNALEKKGIVEFEKRKVSRLASHELEAFANFTLTETQTAALEQIKVGFEQKSVQLLHGITASGKTQIYIKLIEEVLAKGKQALFLVPEIALTTQIVERISKYFGDKIGVYHSKFNENERVEIWNKVLNGSYGVVLGARSSVFLPFKNLDLVVIDEEHESSYKQYDPAPRYQARDAAIYLASLYKAKVLLGSATPSLESYYNALEAKYGLVELNERFRGVSLPEQQIVSLSEATQKKTLKAYFTEDLIQQMADILAQKQQIILFQNRRGYTTILLCGTCGYNSRCVNCDVSLTYHKTTGNLHCHYCGYHQNILKSCPACGSTNMLQKGFGTERVEEELEVVFPGVRTARLDLDSTRTRNSMLKIITDFQEKKTDVLIGTQMVTKGLDFDNVALIGVINADTLLNFPDFRAFERAFQLLTQVAGRAGRRDVAGKVLIQAYNPHHKILKHVVENNYAQMYADELQERKDFKYPPFTKLISIDLKSKDPQLLHFAARSFADQLKHYLGNMVIGPEQPLVARVRSYFIEQITLKIPRDISVQNVKDLLKSSIQQFNEDKKFRSVRVQVDVDPY